MNKLSSSSRKSEFIFSLGNPILPSFVVNQSCVRNIAKPHLQLIDYILLSPSASKIKFVQQNKLRQFNLISCTHFTNQMHHQTCTSFFRLLTESDEKASHNNKTKPDQCKIMLLPQNHEIRYKHCSMTIKNKGPSSILA